MTEQMILANTVDVTKEVDGIEMGVLRDGTAYLTGRGVARLCGTAVSTIIYQKDEWAAGKRSSKFAKMLIAQGYDEPELIIPVMHEGRAAHAYPEAVCMTFLEYFAFESSSPSAPVASANFRKLARAGLKIFVYTALGYDPAKLVPPVWRQFHDRLTLATSPVGYFSVFKELAEFVLGTIKGGLAVDDKTIPDISVGQAWATFWKDAQLAAQFGERIQHVHNYPPSYPQALSNPQDIWVYPVDAIGEFRRWMQREYVPKRFPKYLDAKVRRGVLGASTAEMLVLAATAPEPLLPAKT